MTQHLEMRSYSKLHPKNWLVISTPADMLERPCWWYVEDKKTSFSKVHVHLTTEEETFRSMVSTSVQLCVVENLGIATEVLHLSRYCWMLKWLMPKAILKWGNQQEAIHQFNCHLFPWPISSNTRRLEYQLLLFKVASHPNSKQLYICCSTQFYLYFSSFFMEGYALLCQYVTHSCKSLSPFAWKNEWSWLWKWNYCCVVPLVRLVFTKVSLENAKSEKNEHSS